MSRIATNQRIKLDKIIHSMEVSKQDFIVNPKKDFTRNRKLNFSAMLKTSLSMGTKSLSKEFLVPKRFLESQVTPSAFIQQRRKIKIQAYRHLFDKFNESIDIKTHKNYQILAIDGTSIQITTDKNDLNSYSNNQHGGYNYLHLNVLYDVCTGIYSDVLIQAANTSNEFQLSYSFHIPYLPEKLLGVKSISSYHRI
jgi:hypothetical protein